MPTPAIHRPRTPRRNEHGLALILVLWMLTVLSLIAAGFLAETRSETRMAQARIGQAEAAALADGGIYLVTERLLRGDRRGAGGEAGAGAEWPIDGRPVTLDLDSGRLQVEIQDIGGLIDLNGGSPDMLAGLIATAGVPPREAEILAVRIADFRDPDGSPGFGGAERAAYRAAGLAYGPKNDLFVTVGELRQVLGFDHALVEALAPSLTVYSAAQGIDPSVAPPQVLAGLPGFTEDALDRFLRLREADPLAAFPDLPVEAALVSSPHTTFRIRATASTAAGGTFTREAVVQLQGGGRPFLIRSWRQGLTDRRS